MSQNQDLQSYKTLKSYLDSIDVDTSNMDNDTLDYQYLQRLRKKNEEALSTQEQREGGIALKQYLADAQALQEKNKNIALAENNARQETAYNDYVNSKLAKYLNIAEENNGTAGYTGITEGNRIALANQEKNIASNIQSEKQSAISDYLKKYNDTLASNSQSALDQTTTFWGEMDKKDADEETQRLLQESNEKLEKQTFIANAKKRIDGILSKWGTLDNGAYKKEALTNIKEYIDRLDLTDEEKRDLLEEYTDTETFESESDDYKYKKYSWERDYVEPSTEEPSTEEPNDDSNTNTNNIIQTMKENNTYARLRDSSGNDVTFKTKLGNHDITDDNHYGDWATYKFSMDNEEYYVKGEFKYSDPNQLAKTIGMGNNDKYGRKAEDVQKITDILTTMRNGDAICYYTPNGNDTPQRYVIYKKEDKYYLFAKQTKGTIVNTIGKYEKGFLKLYKTLENKKLILNDLVKE